MGFSIIIPLTMPSILPVDTSVIYLIELSEMDRMTTVHFTGDDSVSKGTVYTFSYSLFSYHILIS